MDVKEALARIAEPVAYAVFASNGNIRIWCADPVQVETLRQQYGEALQPLYAAPQPAEQQPAPGAAGLVEALTELCDEIDKHEIHAAISKKSISWFKRKARKALAAHRSRGEV